MNPIKQELIEHVKVIKMIVYILIGIFLVMLITRPILINISNKNYWKNSILSGNPIVFEVSEVIVDDRGFVFTQPEKIILKVVKDKYSKYSNIYKIEIVKTE